MHRYRVYDTCVEDRKLVLYDSAGRYHRVRVTAEMPLLWDELQGQPPARGFSLLMAPTGQVFRTIFEEIDLQHPFTLQRLLHGQAVPAPSQPATGSDDPARMNSDRS